MTRALSIRQPFAELILRGMKTVEYRSKPTRIVGEGFLIYAAKGGWRTKAPSRVWSRDLSADQSPPWMWDLAEHLILGDLPTGVIVGSAVIERVEQIDGGSTGSDGQPALWAWHLTGVRRAKTLRRPTGHPQPVWFRPF